MEPTQPRRAAVRAPAPGDRQLLDRAVALGRRGWGRVHPNPMVGCVIAVEGEVVGEGWHREFGGAHAETEALNAAGDAARGATAYVSLEPCRHEGKTPPCTRALIEAGIARVVFGARDPHLASGGGAEELATAGVEVVGPLLGDREARRENPAFFHAGSERPWTALKLAVSLDGRIAARPGVRTTISGDAAAEAVQCLRAGFDAILVGTETAVIDNPLLTVRGAVEPRVPPIRIVLDARGRIGTNSRVLTEGTAPTWLLTTSQSPPGWREEIRGRGGRPLEVPSCEAGRVALEPALRILRGEGISALLCEGGGALGSALLERGLVDRLHLIVSGRFLGADGVPAFPGTLPVEGRWRPVEEPRTLGTDVWLALDREEG